jgi:lipopolysaccharide transport system permease protein
MLDSASPSSEPAAWVIRPDVREGFLARVREVWQYRHTLSFFALQSLRTLYAKTHLGLPWLFIRTLLPLLIGSWVFGSVMQVPSGTIPYFIFFNTGQLAWNCFDGPLVRASRGLAVNRELLSKLYIPRIILPLAQMTSGIVEPAIMTVVLVLSVFYYRVHDGVWYVHATPRLFFAPLAVLQILVFALALSFWTSVWQARARDVRFILRYTIGFWMYITPVIYPISKIPESIRWVAYLNPLTAPVEMFKWAVLPNMEHSWKWGGYSLAVTVALFAAGAWYFDRVEGATVDRM